MRDVLAGFWHWCMGVILRFLQLMTDRFEKGFSTEKKSAF